MHLFHKFCMRFLEMAVAVDQHHGIKPLSRSQRCNLQSFTSHLDHNIFPHYSLKHACQVANNNIHKSLSTPCLSLIGGSSTSALDQEDFDTNIPRIEVVGDSKIPRVHALVVEVALAMASGADLLPVSSGLGGAYFLSSSSRNGDNNIIAVAKPIDEEPFAFNNPKGVAGRMLGQPGLKRSVRIGESGSREFAAYLLDHGGFAGVPPTALVKMSHAAFRINNSIASAISATPYKIASLQRYVNHDFDAGELGFSGFSVDSVHHIGIFDIRVLNLDRHAGNMLVKKYDKNFSYASDGVAELVPIDHGLSLPECLDDPYFEWLHWPQASVPFSESEIDYISNLDPSKDAQLLRTQIPSLREAAIRVLVLCTIFLKRATAAGLCLADIGEMMTRQFCAEQESLSELENLCLRVKAAMLRHCDKTKHTTRNMDVVQFGNDGKQGFDDENRNLPQVLQINPGMSRFSSAGSIIGLSHLFVGSQFKEIDHDTTHVAGAMIGNNGNVQSLKDSGSVSVNNLNCETGGISFGDMSEDEWDLFLDSFEKILPNMLCERKIAST